MITKCDLNARGVCHFRFVPDRGAGGKPAVERSAVDSGTVASYLGGVLDELIIAPSAYMHGLSREDIPHAYRKPLGSGIWATGSP